VSGGAPRRGLRRLAAAVVALLTVTGCGFGPSSTPSPVSALGAHARFYVDPDGHAVQAVADLQAAGERAEAERLQRRIASRPSAFWLTSDPDAVYAEAREVASAAAARRELPVLAAYDVPQRDCGGYSSGGAADMDAYLHWVGSMAAGIGPHRAVVVLEPDAVAHSLDGCLDAGKARERHRMLAEAVRIIERQPRVHVYLDAGNASWIDDVDRLAVALRASGVAEADGFALNVSNFESTARSLRYGDRLSRRLGGAHYVVDTSRNGAGGPGRSADPASHGAWCNPRGARLGRPPTSDTGHARVDAFLWVKQPGDSDGVCGAGAPPAGQWWPDSAARLMTGAGG
jgi:endoglucanase